MKNKHFSFGKNWTYYVNRSLNKEKIDNAQKSLLKYFPKQEYKNKFFIDVGCGSGVFSLNALQLGCKKVVSFDIDENSVKAARITKNKFSYLIPNDSTWNIFNGSILDKSLIQKYRKQADIVYSWGVLHHTGNMYQAIQNASQLVAPNGYFILAIYNKTPASNFWLKIKKFYNSAPSIIQKIMILINFFYVTVLHFARILKNLVTKKLTTSPLSGKRGMNIFYDSIDWLGGYPYEYATFDEIKDFVEKLDFELIKAPTKLLPPDSLSFWQNIFCRFLLKGTGNNEFVFKNIIR